MVTGATTPLGEAFVRQLSQHPDVDHVLAVGREPKNHAGVFETMPGVTYATCDLSRGRRVRTLMFGEVTRLEITHVVHLAMHRSAANTGGKAFKLNVEGTRELLALCERHPSVRRFVFRSFSDVYEVKPSRPAMISEDHALNLGRSVPRFVRDRVAADLMVCTRMGMSPLSICVLRTAECLAADVGSQLHDYLQSQVCLKPLGFDPMLNLLSLTDLASALTRATLSDAQGIFNIPGADTLPLSEVIRRWGCTPVPLPGPVLSPLYRLRAAATGTDFSYGLNFWRFHFSGVLEGRRARDVLGYEPRSPLYWPAG